jgi:hypothetical protein
MYSSLNFFNNLVISRSYQRVSLILFYFSPLGYKCLTYLGFVWSMIFHAASLG